jgi:hypothetical protein
MNHFSLFYYTLIFSIFFSDGSNKHSSDPIEKIRATFQLWLLKMPEEKVHLHLDRDVYGAGEMLWLKAYLTAGPFHQPSTLSHTLNVELMNSEMQLIKREVLYSADGFTSGYLQLPDTLPSGSYVVTAYTNWMRNLGEEYFFQREIQVYNEETHNTNTTTYSDSLDIQFFPEGGQLVEGLFSKVAYKVIGADGLGRQVHGKLMKGETEIFSFSSNSLGMGILPLQPETGVVYTAIIKDHVQDFMLPAALPSGLVMAVTNDRETDFIQVKLVSKNVSYDEIYLIAQSRGLVCASAKVDMGKNAAVVRLPRQEFPSGIAQLTLVDDTGLPLAERLVYIDQDDQLRLSIQASKEIYQPREEVKLEIEALTKDGSPVQGNFSLRVVDSNAVDQMQPFASLRTHLLLTSELKGYVENPEYYFDPNNTDRWKALDYLMLTQGWRKYSIQEAILGQLPEPVFDMEKGLNIRGQVVEKQSRKAINNGTVSFLSLNPVVVSVTEHLDKDGKFELRDLFFLDSSEVLLEVNSGSNRKPLEILIDKEENAALQKKLMPTFHRFKPTHETFMDQARIRSAIEKAFALEDGELLLDKVEVTAKKISESYSGPKIYGEGTVKLQVAGNTALENLIHPLDVIQGRIAGVQVVGSGANKTVAIQGIGSLNSSSRPLIMVDDIPVPFESLYSLPVMEIEQVTVWKGADTAIFGARGANGAIGFYTKRGKTVSAVTKPEQGNRLPKGIRGYQMSRSYYSPKYNPEQLPNPKPDHRLTLHWEPMIETDASGKASVKFFNHDLESSILIELVGLSDEGLSGSVLFQYQIKK